MTKKTLKLTYLILSCVFAVVAVAMMVFAGVKSIKFDKSDYSHNIKIDKITLNTEKSNETIRVLAHDVVISGSIKNNTKNDVLLGEIQIVFGGIKSETGEYKEFTFEKEIRDLKSGLSINFDEEMIGIMSRDGYIPEEIKAVNLSVNGVTSVAEFEESNDLYLILFAVAIGFIFVAGLMLAKWDNLRKKIANENNKGE